MRRENSAGCWCWTPSRTDMWLVSEGWKWRWSGQFIQYGRENGMGWNCPVLQQVGLCCVITWHFSTASAVNGCKIMNDATFGWQYIEPCSFIPHWVQWEVLRSDGLSKQPSRRLRRLGFFNFDISEYFDKHKIWIRRLLAKTVMLDDEDFLSFLTNDKLIKTWNCCMIVWMIILISCYMTIKTENQWQVCSN